MKKTAKEKNFIPADFMSALVNEELAQDSFYHPNLAGITQGGMANHYPMTIMAMQALGASDGEIITFRDAWPRHRADISQELGLADAKEVTTENWRQYLGQSDKLIEFRRVFLHQLSQGDVAEVVTGLVDAMKGSLPMGLFHPLIRLSFACEHGDPGLIADALAYMAIRYQELYFQEPKAAPLVAEPSGSCALGFSSLSGAGASWSSIRQWLQKEHLPGRLSRNIYGGSISICEQLCREPVVHRLALGTGSELNEQKLSLLMSGVCQSAARLYVFEPALTTLHGVTASQALAQLTLRYANRENRQIYARLWRYFWVWLTALYIEKGCPWLADLFSAADSANKQEEKEVKSVEQYQQENLTAGQLQLSNWPKLKRLALRSQEVHVMKMVYSCYWLYNNVSQEQCFQLAAIKALP
ncbi:questin oxidase family protein [Thalassomonas haliotis]|uniref:Questin oxidase family protein n=1 Tax=Thalassomonas haliotis TaxID=485448 RepID=A0ABY7V9L2_9GAMM|nr:questin oxidase family protein [Thalassomonas haliotis]WDE09996.1 questin oxidase family protein [Thalassomonas haliotis]